MALTSSTVLQSLRERVALAVGRDTAEIAADKPLHELGLDSMGFVDLLVYIEKEFGLALLSAGLVQDDFASLAVLAERVALAATK